MTANFTAAQRRRRRRRAITTAILNIRRRWRNAGYADVAVHDRRAGLPVADPERLGLPLLASRATRARAPAAAASGTTTPTGPTTPRCRRSTARCSTRGRRPGCPTSRSSSSQSAFNGRRLCENTVGLLEEKGLTPLDAAGRGRQDRVGQPDPHGLDGLRRPTTSRSRCTRTTGASWRCATACARPTTAARRRAARARAGQPGSPPPASP